jgi:hypothetical protein
MASFRSSRSSSFTSKCRAKVQANNLAVAM